jgi:hypothetical protein
MAFVAESSGRFIPPVMPVDCSKCPLLQTPALFAACAAHSHFPPFGSEKQERPIAAPDQMAKRCVAASPKRTFDTLCSVFLAKGLLSGLSRNWFLDMLLTQHSFVVATMICQQYSTVHESGHSDGKIDHSQTTPSLGIWQRRSFYLFHSGGWILLP